MERVIAGIAMAFGFWTELMRHDLVGVLPEQGEKVLDR